MELLGYFASILIGVVLGLLGGGGSILTIPILVYIFHYDAVIASAYSLFIVGITSLVGVIPKQRDHLVDLRMGLVFGLPSIISIFITRKWIVPAIPEVILQFEHGMVTKRMLLLGLFSLLMILASISMLARRKTHDHESKVQYSPIVALEGLLIGFLTGLVGAGGGFLIIPALVLITGLKFKTAVGTSLLIIGVNSLMGFLGDVLNYAMDWTFLFSITTLAVCGILIGTRLSQRVAVPELRKGFAIFVLATGCWILLQEFYLS